MRQVLHDCSGKCRNRGALTLIELLVDVVIISLLLAISLPVWHLMLSRSRRVTCQMQLRQIGLAWGLYLNDSGEVFYQGVNANHDFGGWKGTGGFGISRPLNRYAASVAGTAATAADRTFHCPSDAGGILGRPPTQQAFVYYGNSYQTNILLIGPDQVVVPPGDLGRLHGEINKRLQNLKRNQVDHPSRLLLVGDDTWVNQWLPGVPQRLGWHGDPLRHNLTFLDGHVEYLHIRKGLYVADGYSVVPFDGLYGLAHEVQKEEAE